VRRTLGNAVVCVSHSKDNAQAARCTGEITVNGWDKISSEP
jgi:hypothetical protein